jgi:hypothetical protein
MIDSIDRLYLYRSITDYVQLWIGGSEIECESRVGSDTTAGLRYSMYTVGTIVYSLTGTSKKYYHRKKGKISSSLNPYLSRPRSYITFLVLQFNKSEINIPYHCLTIWFCLMLFCCNSRRNQKNKVLLYMTLALLAMEILPLLEC